MGRMCRQAFHRATDREKRKTCQEMFGRCLRVEGDILNCVWQVNLFPLTRNEK